MSLRRHRYRTQSIVSLAEYRHRNIFRPTNGTAAYQRAMALHQRAMAVCKAASLFLAVSSGASLSPDTPNTLGAALTQGTNPQAAPPPWGFCFGRPLGPFAIVPPCRTTIHPSAHCQSHFAIGLSPPSIRPTRRRAIECLLVVHPGDPKIAPYQGRRLRAQCATMCEVRANNSAASFSIAQTALSPILGPGGQAVHRARF
jgi:hypothetical protein